MNKIIKTLASFSFLVFSSGAFAQVTNVGSMFIAFQPSIQALIKLTIAVSMILGLGLIIGSIYKLAQLSESGGQRGETIKGPIFMFFCGVALFGLMLSLRTVGQTLLLGAGPGDILMPATSSNAVAGAGMVAILWFVRLIGFIAVVRGFLLLNKHGQGGNQGELGRAMTHIFGGVFAIHIDKTAKILAATFSPGFNIPIS